MSAKRTAIYAGTFDPVTTGHLDIIARGAQMVDTLIVAVSSNEEKEPLFSLQERVAMVGEECLSIKNGGEILVKPFGNLLVDFAREQNAGILMRGLRAVSDFDYEFQMAVANSRLAPDLETMFLMASERHQLISSRFVKEICRLGGDVSHFVTPNVAKKLKRRFEDLATQSGSNQNAA